MRLTISEALGADVEKKLSDLAGRTWTTVVTTPKSSEAERENLRGFGVSQIRRWLLGIGFEVWRKKANAAKTDLMFKQAARGIAIYATATAKRLLVEKPWTAICHDFDKVVSILKDENPSLLAESLPRIPSECLDTAWWFGQLYKESRASFYALGADLRHLWSVMACRQNLNMAQADTFIWTCSLYANRNMESPDGDKSATLRTITTMLCADPDVQTFATQMFANDMEIFESYAKTEELRGQILNLRKLPDDVTDPAAICWHRTLQHRKAFRLISAKVKNFLTAHRQSLRRPAAEVATPPEVSTPSQEVEAPILSPIKPPMLPPSPYTPGKSELYASDDPTVVGRPSIMSPARGSKRQLSTSESRRSSIVPAAEAHELIFPMSPVTHEAVEFPMIAAAATATEDSSPVEMIVNVLGHAVPPVEEMPSQLEPVVPWEAEPAALPSTEPIVPIVEAERAIPTYEGRSPRFVEIASALRICPSAVQMIAPGQEAENQAFAHEVSRILAAGETCSRNVVPGAAASVVILARYFGVQGIYKPAIAVVTIQPSGGICYNSDVGYARILAGDLVGDRAYIFGIANIRADRCLPCIDTYSLESPAVIDAPGVMRQISRFMFTESQFELRPERPFAAVGQQSKATCKTFSNVVVCWTPHIPQQYYILTWDAGGAPKPAVFPIKPTPDAVCFAVDAMFLAYARIGGVRVVRAPYDPASLTEMFDFADVAGQGLLNVHLEPWSRGNMLLTASSHCESWSALYKDSEHKLVAVLGSTSPTAAGHTCVRLNETEFLMLSAEIAAGSVHATLAWHAEPALQRVIFAKDAVMQGVYVSTTLGLRYALQEPYTGCANRVHCSSHGDYVISCMSHMSANQKTIAAISTVSPLQSDQAQIHCHTVVVRFDVPATVVSSFPRHATMLRRLGPDIVGGLLAVRMPGARTIGFDALTGEGIIPDALSEHVPPVGWRGLCLAIDSLASDCQLDRMICNPPPEIDTVISGSPLPPLSTVACDCVAGIAPATNIGKLLGRAAMGYTTKEDYTHGDLICIAPVRMEPERPYEIIVDTAAIPQFTDLDVSSDTKIANCFFWYFGGDSPYVALIATAKIPKTPVPFVWKDKIAAWKNERKLFLKP